MTCPFCERIAADDYDERLGGVVHFEPLHPVTPGHRLFLPAVHTEWIDPAAPGEMAACLRTAVRYARGHGWRFNLITNCGEAATQTVAHVHLHLVPRRPGDGLALPWSKEAANA